MSKGSLLRVLVLLQAVCLGLLAGNQVIVPQIGDEFLCQDPIRRPSLMLSRVHDELNSTNAPQTLTKEIPDEEVLSGDEYVGDEEVLFGDQYARDPDNFVDDEEDRFVDEEEGENPLLSGQDIDVEANNNSEEYAGGVDDVQCPECGKHFKNDKSMFGHLRSHPNRGYKGATPPAKQKLLSNHNVASPASSSPVDNRPVARYSQRDPRLNTYEILAAYVMLTLKYRDNQATPFASHQCNERKYESIELDVPEEDSVMSKAGADVLLRNEHSGPVAEMAGADVLFRNEHSGPVAEIAGADTVHHNEHGSSIVEVPRKRGRKKSKEGREAHTKEKPLPSAKEKRPYICKHCKAEFPTHQALGGHMAAHNKDKRIQVQNEQAAGEAYQGKIDTILNGQEAEGGGEERGRDGLSLSSRELLMEHYTKMFNKGLQSRQEPGGYMRYMRQDIQRKDGGSPPVAASTADEERRRPFDIDLNVEAPEQE